MNMSDYSCGTIELNNGPNGRLKTSGFLDWILVYGPLKHIHGLRVKEHCISGALRIRSKSRSSALRRLSTERI